MQQKAIASNNQHEISLSNNQVNEILPQIEEYNPIHQSLQRPEPSEKVNSVFDLADVSLMI